jgi:hypothetical protein
MIQLPRISYAGQYRLWKIKDGSATYDSGWFDNLITDGGLDQFANIPLGTGGIPYLFTGAHVGTGTATPAFTDTSLTNYLASATPQETGGTNSYIAASGSNPPYWRFVKIFTFPVGTVTGVLSEVGVGNTKDTLFSHALILNQFGDVQTVEVLADEGIQLAYELRSYINPSDVPMTVTFSGNTIGSNVVHDLVIRPCAMSVAKSLNIGMGYSHNNIALYSGNIQSNVQVPLGTSTSLTSYVNIDPYTAGDYYVSYSQQFLETVGNYSIPALRTSSQQFDFQVGVTPPVLKTGNYILTIGFILRWGRYTP